MLGGALAAAHGAIPRSDSGFAWVLPAILGGAAGGILRKLAGLPNHDNLIADAGR